MNNKKIIANIIIAICVFIILFLCFLEIETILNIPTLAFPTTSITTLIFLLLYIIFFIKLIKNTIDYKNGKFKKKNHKISLIILVVATILLGLAKPINSIILKGHETICKSNSEYYTNIITFYHRNKKIINANFLNKYHYDTLSEALENEKDFCNECNPNDGCNYCTTKIDNNTLIVEFEEKYDDSDYTDTIKMYEKKLNYTCVEH